jgi:hypothetical protein
MRTPSMIGNKIARAKTKIAGNSKDTTNPVSFFGFVLFWRDNGIDSTSVVADIFFISIFD